MVHLTPDALETMLKHRQKRVVQREAGGVLLGRLLVERPDAIVDMATEPQRTDRRSRFAFFRSQCHERIAQARWLAMSETSAYLGSWHTHPEADPAPSATDLSDWQKALRTDAFAGSNLFFVIVGTECLRLWVGNRAGRIETAVEEDNAQRQ